MTEFPNRPTHDDFWLLCEIVQDYDSAADDGATVEQLVNPVVDLESLLYTAEQRALRASKALRDPFLALQAMWLDAFIVGALYQKRKQS